MTAVTTYTDSAPKREDRRQGAILGVVLVVVGLVSFIGVGLLELAARDAEETSRAVINTRAFWLAEAGMQRITKRLFDQLSGDVATTDFGYGNYQVWLYDKAIIPYAVALGQSGSSKRYIRANLIYLGGPFETAVFGANEAGGEWVLDLRGIGDPVQSGPDEVGGRDIINGNVFVAGDFFMTEESEVNALPSPNIRERNGDVEAQSANMTPSDSPHKTAASRGSSGAVLFHDRINLSSQFRRELSSLMHLQEAMPISAGGGHVLPFRPTTYSAALICRFSSLSMSLSRRQLEILRRNSTKSFSQKQNSDNNKNKTDHD